MTAPIPAGRESLLRLVSTRTGLRFPPSRAAGADAAVRRAMIRAGIDDADRYLALVRDTTAAFDQLVEELTVGETYFFREPAQLDVIRREVLPPLLRGGAAIRGWSAGSATGEEAYSLAILLHELDAPRGSRILGTDVARGRLARAAHARYGSWSLRGVPEQVVEKYFRRNGRSFDLVPEIRDMVQFRHLNLAEDAYPSSPSGPAEMDLILCRNVLIYLDPATIADVARRLLASLREGGWLFLGASDPLLSDLVPCEVVATDAGLAYRRPTARRRTPAPADRAAAPEEASRPAAEARLPSSSLPALPPPRRPATTWVPPAAGASGDAAALRVRELIARGLLAEAGRACAEGLDRHRVHAELVYLHSLLLAEAGRHREAARAARAALYLDRTLVVAQLSLGTARARHGDRDGACRALRAADALLSGMAPEAVVPASGGETAGRLLGLARAQLRLLQPEAA